MLGVDTKILESSMVEIMKNSNDLLNFWFAFLSVIMIVFTFASIFINNNILSESKENLEYIENLKKEMEEFKYEAKKLIFDMDIETQKNINKQQDNINNFLKDIDKQYKETSYYIDKEKTHINDTMNSIKNELEKLKLENEKAFDNINKIKDESSKSIENIKKQAEEETKKLIEENNINIEISNLFNSAYQADNNKEYDNCINYYNQIIEMTDNLLNGYDKNSEEYSKYTNICSMAYNNRGTAKANLGLYQEAIEDYNESIRLNPNNSEAYNNRGITKEKLKDYNKEEAIKDYDKAIELNPNSSKAYNNRGGAKVNLGQYKEAIKDFDKAIELNPNNSDAYFNIALTKQLLANTTKDENEKNKLIEEIYNDFMKGYRLADDNLKEEYKQRIINLANPNNRAILKICDKMGWKQ